MLESGLLCLPSTRTLQRLGEGFSLSSDAYLSARVQELDDDRGWEKNVVLMVDEIHLAKRVEFSRSQGEITGLTPNNSVASTLLSFMVRTNDGVLYKAKRNTFS